jgi:hypothetical protein
MMDRLGDQVEKELVRGGSHNAPLVAITTAWPSVVGETVARQAWPLRIGRDGTLHVATSSSTWAFELDRLSGEILEKLSAHLADGAPKKMRFAAGPLPEPGMPTVSVSPPSVAPPSFTLEEAAAADAAAAAIDDPELRELVARAARASLAKARSGRHF